MPRALPPVPGYRLPSEARSGAGGAAVPAPLQPPGLSPTTAARDHQVAIAGHRSRLGHGSHVAFLSIFLPFRTHRSFGRFGCRSVSRHWQFPLGRCPTAPQRSGTSPVKKHYEFYRGTVFGTSPEDQRAGVPRAGIHPAATSEPLPGAQRSAGTGAASGTSGRGWGGRDVKSPARLYCLYFFCIANLNYVFVKPQSLQLLVSKAPFSPTSLMSVMQIRMITLSE